MKKKIFLVLGVIILLALAGRGYWAYQQMKSAESLAIQVPVGHDIAPIDDSDLRLPKVVVADNENAYFDLIKIDKSVLYWNEEKRQVVYDMLAGKTWDAQLAQELISKNTEAFKYLTDASLKPKYQNPVSADPAKISPSDILPPLQIWRSVAFASALKSLLLSKQGKDKEAIIEAMRLIDIGQKMQNSQSTLIEYLVASSIKNTGLQAIQKILITSKLKINDLGKHTKDLTQYYKNEEGLTQALKAEYYTLFSSLDLIAVGLIGGNKEALDLANKVVGTGGPDLISLTQKLTSNFYFEPNKTKLLYANFFRSQIADINKSCWDMNGYNVEKLDLSSFEEVKKVENAIGIILHDVTAESMDTVQNKRCQEDALVGTTQTMLAIKAFKNDTKKYPATLDELVPKYLDVVPTDPFDGKQLKYSAEKKIIYSIGVDKQDNGGVMSDETKKVPDIVYQIGF